jgi:hypothetical protein
MSVPRKLSAQEKAVMSALLRDNPEIQHFADELEDLVAIEMDDGGMGSLSLISKRLDGVGPRTLGKEIAVGEFLDRDGVTVSVAINVDREKRLYELDVWKVDFSPLLHWPDSGKIQISRMSPP